MNPRDMRLRPRPRPRTQPGRRRLTPEERQFFLQLLHELDDDQAPSGRHAQEDQ